MSKSGSSLALHARPHAVLLQLLTGKWISQAISTAVELGIPERLSKGARRCRDIATDAGVPEDGLYRLLRALASLGLFAEGSGRFKLTTMGELLRNDCPESLAGFARFMGHDITWRPWGRLSYSVKTGLPAFDEVFGAPLFEYFSTHPEAAAVFDKAMTSISATQASATAAAYDFRGIETLMDVAGGHGLLLATVLRRHKTMRGVLFDLPHVAAGAAATFTRFGVADRVRVETGDFFKALPPGADAIIMKYILHDWDDKSAIRILETCHRALGPRGKVLIVDAVVPPGNSPHYGKLLDLNMLVLTPRGRERTKAEFKELVGRAGFRLARVIATDSPLSIVEAVKSHRP